MKKYRHAPYFRNGASLTGNSVLERLVALSGVYVLSVYYYGPRVLLMSVISAVIAAGIGLLASMLFENLRRFDAEDILSAMLLSLLCPACANLFLPAVGTAATVVLSRFLRVTGIKAPNLSLVGFGWLLLAVCFPGQMFTFSDPGEAMLGLGTVTEFVPAESLTAMLKSGDVSSAQTANILLGHLAGPAGATAAAVILACLGYMALRRSAPWQIPVFAIITAFVFCLIFPRAEGNRITLALYEIVAGSFLFASVFLAAQPGVFPMSKNGRYIFGVLLGLITMLGRRSFSLEEVAPAVILVLSLLSFWFDVVGYKAGRLLTFGKKK